MKELRHKEYEILHLKDLFNYRIFKNRSAFEYIVKKNININISTRKTLSANILWVSSPLE